MLSAELDRLKRRKNEIDHALALKTAWGAGLTPLIEELSYVERSIKVLTETQFEPPVEDSDA